MSKKTPIIAAVIDIGSSELRLHIAQAAAQPLFADNMPSGLPVRLEASNGSGIQLEAVSYLESLSFPLSLGRDTFHAGKMSFDKIDTACEVIKNFLHVAKGYGVRPQNVRTIASTAMREAANLDYILDQIKIKTGVNVHVMDDLEEKTYICKLLTHYAEDSLKKSAVIVYIGTGSIGVNLFVDGKMPRTWNIRVGSLRMSELFGDLQEYTREFYRLMEEYLAGYTYKLRQELPKGIHHFIVSGQEIDAIANLTTGVVPPLETPLFEIPRNNFQALYDRIKRQTTDRIASTNYLDADKAESLLPAACIYQNLLDCTAADVITASRMLPCDAILFEMLYPKRFAAINKRFEKGTVLSARELAKRHNANIPHSELVRDFAIMIFDKIRKLHGLGNRDEILLTVAAYLHDIGESVNTLDHHKISYGLVRRSDIVGLTQSEQEIVALICRYHSATPDLDASCYTILPPETKVRVSKLAAMLRLADSIDRSHTQKSNNIDVKLSENSLLITITADKNLALEQWAFAEKGRFFEEVFGIKASLRVRKV
ncbi:MAG: HD domain-containing protein [Defluviitaleaceae bacterium]|nr:HD domain-containing protein [Defluviitaleaceae bacterium]